MNRVKSLRSERSNADTRHRGLGGAAPDMVAFVMDAFIERLLWPYRPSVMIFLGTPPHSGGQVLYLAYSSSHCALMILLTVV